MSFSNEIINKMQYSDAKLYLIKYPELIIKYNFSENEFKDFVLSNPDVILTSSFLFYKKSEISKYIIKDWINIYRGTHQYYSLLNSDYVNLLDNNYLKKEMRYIVNNAISGNNLAKDFVSYYKLLPSIMKYKDFTVKQNEYLRNLYVKYFEISDLKTLYINEFILSYDFVNKGYINKLSSLSINAYVEYMHRLYKHILYDNIKSEKCEEFVKNIFQKDYISVKDIIYRIIRFFNITKYDDILKHKMSEYSVKSIDVKYVKVDDIIPSHLESLRVYYSSRYSYSKVKHFYNNYTHYFSYKFK